MSAETFILERAKTPIGQMLVLTDEQHRLRAVDWEDYEQRMLTLLRRQYGKHPVELRESSRLGAATLALLAYFDGELQAIDALPVATGGTEFQREVWAGLRTIPCGQTLSYGTLASRINRPAAVRAVGAANGANPISIVVPCHRVIGANASLTGYAGGLARKQWLLEHERRAA